MTTHSSQTATSSQTLTHYEKTGEIVSLEIWTRLAHKNRMDLMACVEAYGDDDQKGGLWRSLDRYDDQQTHDILYSVWSSIDPEFKPQGWNVMHDLVCEWQSWSTDCTDCN